MNNLLHQDLSYLIRGIIFEIRNNYGPGQKEIIYQNLFKELLKQKTSNMKKKNPLVFFLLIIKRSAFIDPTLS